MKKFRGMMYFLAGVVFTVVVMFSFFSTQEADAGACHRTSLDFLFSAGSVPSTKQIQIRYSFPKCLYSWGYKAVEVRNVHDNYLNVIYEKVDN